MKNPIDRPHLDVTAGLIFRDGKVLISRRRKGSHLGGFWEFPGGKREKRETLKRCLEREIEEELGMRVRAEKHCLTVKYAYDTRYVSLHVFQCTRVAGEPKPLQNDGIRWVEPSELESFSFPPPDLKVIEYLCHGPDGQDSPTRGSGQS